ncbi:MAG TPA: helix-turn-helix domain-containing protein [Mycobacterium sp.]|jgi:AcrR family transcriptional regulator|nr:helix-turn-helix domain-containing protein [Mycobacterium sp.]
MSSSPADERPRVGREATREALIEATAQIMLDEGYAAATSRRVAAKAGVKSALVHYYFPSMDDLFVAVLRDKAEANLQHQRQAMAEAEPLHALWQLTGAQDAQLFTEFLAMANHRKAIRSEIVSYAMRFRDIEEGAMTLALKARGIDLESFPPVVMSMIMGSLARMVLHEKGLGITRGHDQAKAFIEQCLDRFEMPSWDPHRWGTGQVSDAARLGGSGVTSDTIT